MTLEQFNQASADVAQQSVAHCVALPEWSAALVAARPYRSLAALLEQGAYLAQHWDGAALNLALSAHPRIGERAAGVDSEAACSRQEQAQVDSADSVQAEMLRTENRAYEQRFGRVFLIRAKGRSGAQILAELRRRLLNAPQQEQQEALGQLQEITLLRLREVFQ